MPDEIHVWLAFPAEIRDAAGLARYRELLSEEEVQRQARLRLAGDRSRDLVTRALLRTTLSRYAQVRPADWRFVRNAQGRPEIDTARHAVGALDFNLSHSGRAVALAVGRHARLGIDVEDTGARQPALEVADRLFAADEAAALHALPPADRHRRFFEYWTLKEACLKAQGTGLSTPLDGIRVHFDDDDSIRVSITGTPGQDSEPGWRFWQFRPAPDVVVSLCARREPGPPPRIVVRKTIPLGADTPLSCTGWRASKP